MSDHGSRRCPVRKRAEVVTMVVRPSVAEQEALVTGPDPPGRGFWPVAAATKARRLGR